MDDPLWPLRRDCGRADHFRALDPSNADVRWYHGRVFVWLEAEQTGLGHPQWANALAVNR